MLRASKTSWYRPADAVGFFPATPKRELANSIQKITEEEGKRIGIINIKIYETGGVSLKSQLVRTDLTECVFPDCMLCESGLRGASHSRRGAVYGAKCELCEKSGVLAEYIGETGDNAFHRSEEHKNDVRSKNTKNALAKHLEGHHQQNVADISAFKFNVHSTFSRALDRQVFEGTLISNSEADILMNSKAEFHQPAVTRIVTTREVADRSAGR